MKSALSDFDLIAAPDLESALRLLGEKDGWRPIAGGTDLMVLLNAGKLFAKRLVSIRHLPDLRRIEVHPTEVVLGAAVTYTAIREHSVLRAEFPLLCDAARWTGGIANQNRGTIGGNVVNASPAADSAPPLLVYDALIDLFSIRGERTVPYAEFHTGYKQMLLGKDELLYAVRLPRKFAGWKHYSRKVGARKAQAISKVCFNAVLETKESVVTDLRIAIGSVAPVPLRCFKTEASLRGKEISSELIAAAQAILRTEIAPIDDIRSTADYRGQVTVNLLHEFLTAYDPRRIQRS